MGDEYQLRVDVDQIWKSLYRIDDGTLKLVELGDTVQKIRELKSLDKIFEYYQLLTIADEMPNKVNRTEIYDLVYPVGAVYFTVEVEFDPNDHFTGEWVIMDEQPVREVLMWRRIE